MNNWKGTTLGEICKILSGSTPSTKDTGFWDGNISWITPKDLSGYDNVFIERGERNITDKGLKNSSAQLLPVNTVLFSSRAPIGYIAIAKRELTTNQGFKNIICDEKKTHFKFIYYWLKNRSDYIEKLSSGSTFSEASATLMRSLEINLPSIEEQKQIAAMLSSLDDKIELLRKQNETLEKIAQGVFKEWFVNFKIDGKKLKLKNGIPEEWKVGKIYETGKVVCGKTPSKENTDYFGGKIPFIKIPDMHGQMFLLKTIDKLSKNGADSQKTKTIPKNSICVSCIATVGLVSITTEDSQTNQQINSVVPNDEYLLEYLYFSLKSISGFLNSIGSSGTTTANVNTGTFMNLEILIPAEEHLLLFHKNTVAMFSKIKDNNFQIQTLSRLRDTLLPKLMSGEITI
ncbi:MAG: restriction endonuclease subunit S [Candidatus Moranbacteria bacterium CG06_land_8_20_14_3_00_40_12]|nr:MAG: restriction endonuclease subunit S [Candidatus Moranbacteria bacterium CG23_combo_of_CG06-09_8_20_14_all_40_16]PIU80371.1 MAG: restriction endonuclease subunit S [Candidatus Moranbacteria bacterium CG06_land_8_20_14_3_00_40_12]